MWGGVPECDGELVDAYNGEPGCEASHAVMPQDAVQPQICAGVTCHPCSVRVNSEHIATQH